MATQVGNGWISSDGTKYTFYDAARGQLITRAIDTVKLQQAMSRANAPGSNPNAINQWLSSQDMNQFLRQTDNNYLGGRSNVNVSRQIGALFERIKQQYPNIDKNTAMQYANRWIGDRIAMGWDANQIENMMKDVARGENSINEDFISGVMGNIRDDEYNATPGDATGASMADPRQSIQDELRVFAQQMMQTVGPDSPQAKRIAELAAAAGNRYATSSGMGPGGLTTRGVASTAARAHTDLQTQRESIGLSALAAAGNQQLSVDAAKTALQQQQQQAGVLNASGIGGLIGTGLGAIGGIVGTAYTNGAMAPAIPGLMAAGGAGGQAIGGIIQNSGAPPIQYGGPQQQTSSYSGRSPSTS